MGGMGGITKQTNRTSRIPTRHPCRSWFAAATRDWMPNAPTCQLLLSNLPGDPHVPLTNFCEAEMSERRMEDPGWVPGSERVVA
jgi:hypothetical protein